MTPHVRLVFSLFPWVIVIVIAIHLQRPEPRWVRIPPTLTKDEFETLLVFSQRIRDHIELWRGERERLKGAVGHKLQASFWSHHLEPRLSFSMWEFIDHLNGSCDDEMNRINERIRKFRRTVRRKLREHDMSPLDFEEAQLEDDFRFVYYRYHQMCVANQVFDRTGGRAFPW